MGWRGTLRTIGTISRSIERNARAKQRAYVAQQKQLQKLETLERARIEVEEHENYLELITSMHKESSEIVDWVRIRDLTPPPEPVRLSSHETQAQTALQSYTPGLADRLFRKEDAKRQILQNAIEAGRRKDDEIFSAAMSQFTKTYSEWKEMHDVAIGVLKGDASAYLVAVKEMEPFEEITEIGASASLSVVTPSIARIILHMNTATVIPKESKSLLKSGKLSVKELPVSRYWQLYQDYVCGTVLRVAQETMALLPITKVLVNAVTKMVNPRTGHLEDTIIVSALIPRKTLSSLQIDKADPSDAMSNFLTHMEFKKTAGFQAVEPVDLSNITEE
jgi:hypothetical protein